MSLAREELNAQLGEALNKAQRSMAAHPRAVAELSALYATHGAAFEKRESRFLTVAFVRLTSARLRALVWFRMMQHVLLDANREVRLCEFVVKFVSAHGAGENTFNERTLTWLLKYTDAKCDCQRLALTCSQSLTHLSPPGPTQFANAPAS
jgi:hypothetical protein